MQQIADKSAYKSGSLLSPSPSTSSIKNQIFIAASEFYKFQTPSLSPHATHPGGSSNTVIIIDII